MEASKRRRSRRTRLGATVILLVWAGVLVVMGLDRVNQTPDIPNASAQGLAEEYVRIGDAATAVRYAYVAADSAGAEAWLRLAYFYQERAEWRGMQAALTHVLALEPDHAEAHYELALLLMPYNLRAAYEHLGFARNDALFEASSQALRAMLAEIELLPPASQAARIGQALAALGYWVQAEQALATSLALEPDFARAWAYLALVRAQQNKPMAASAARAVALAPADSLIHFLVGTAWRVQDQAEHALAALLIAQQLDPSNPAIALELGEVYRRLGDLSAAETWLRAAVDLAPDEGGFLRMLALFYAEEAYALTDAGLAVLREAVAQLPQDADIMAAYAWALFSVGEADAAQQALNTVFALHPDHPQGLFYQGRIYQMQDETEAARAVFVRLLTLDAPARFGRMAIRALEQME